MKNEKPKVEYKEVKMEFELDIGGGLPESIGLELPVDDNKQISLDLVRKDEHKTDDIVVILGNGGEDTRWKPHQDDKFNVYSDIHYQATFTVAINKTNQINRISLYGSFHHQGRFYSIRPDDEEFDRHALELDSLQEFFIKIKGHQHILTEDKPLKRNETSAFDYIKADEL